MKAGKTWIEGNQWHVYGSFPLIKVIKANLKGYHVVRWWLGTDAKTLTITPKYGSWKWRYIKLPLVRLKQRVFERLIKWHFAGCHEVIGDLLAFGIDNQKIMFEKYPLFAPKPVENKPTVILYFPRKKTKNHDYKDWIMGGDVARELMEKYKKVYYWIIDSGGNMNPDVYQDIKPYYLHADALVLTKRAKGIPRMKREAEMNNIPVYYAPDNPSVSAIIQYLNKILFHQ